LTPAEIAQLEALGNVADDWSQVHVAEGFDPRRVVGSRFHGPVVLGRFTGRVPVCPGMELPAGVFDSTVADSVIGHNALVRSVRLLANHVVAGGALLLDCGRVTCEPGAAFGIGTALPVALESGGREVPVYAEIDVDVAAAVAGSERRGLLPELRTLVAAYREQAIAGRGVIGERASLQGTPRVHNCYIGPSARVDGATLLADSALLSSEEQPVEVQSGACVDHCILQWGSRVTSLAVVERAVLAENARVERHGKVTDSLVGPGTSVAGGEVTSCLLGPQVGCHHQSLLISAYWPQGRGNVAYGANVGSNHTSRAPDQEFRPGEGMFLGLGVNVKFPADFSRAPYTVVACGVSLLPQRVTFPFSLITMPSAHYPGVSPAYNEIIPAWMLAENLYALKRNEAKYRARDRSRHSPCDFRVFRPDTVDLMRDACRRLEAVGVVRDFYTERDVRGLGKNVLLEKHRRQALEAYRFHIRCYALLGLLERVRGLLAEGQPVADDRLPSAVGASPEWEHQRPLLMEELGVASVSAGLRQLPDLLERVARDVEQAKGRDDVRGARIIEDYATVHGTAADDECVRRTWAEIGCLQTDTARCQAALEGCSCSAAAPQVSEWLPAQAGSYPLPADQ
jgi:hypothetical protein